MDYFCPVLNHQERSSAGGEKPTGSSAAVCLGWALILLSSLLLLCFAPIFAAMNVAGECARGGVNQEVGAAGIPTHLAHLAFCSTLSLNLPRRTHAHGEGDVLFVKQRSEACADCFSGTGGELGAPQ